MQYHLQFLALAFSLQLKARTLLEIEEINKTFTSIHSELVTDQGQTEEPKVLNAKKEKKVEVGTAWKNTEYTEIIIYYSNKVISLFVHQRTDLKLWH